jgi:hypothetical protein
MPKFAVIRNNIVQNIVFADSLEAVQSVITNAECVEYTEEGIDTAHIGLGYSNGVFEQPSVD